MSLLKTLGGVAVALLLSSSPAMAQMVRVRVAPPAPIVERIPMAPSPRHIWTGGHWQWNAMQNRHIWAPGYYQLPQQGQVWVAAHWVNRGGEWIYAPGHWSGAPVQPVYEQPVYQQPQPVYEQPQPVYQQPQPVYEQPQPVYQEPVYQQPQTIEVAAAPPPPQVEVIPVAPSPNHMWIGGYWGWRGGAHVWYPGRYEIRRPGMVWQAPVWNRYGGGWRHTPGYWRR